MGVYFYGKLILRKTKRIQKSKRKMVQRVLGSICSISVVVVWASGANTDGRRSLPRGFLGGGGRLFKATGTALALNLNSVGVVDGHRAGGAGGAGAAGDGDYDYRYQEADDERDAVWMNYLTTAEEVEGYVRARILGIDPALLGELDQAIQEDGFDFAKMFEKGYLETFIKAAEIENEKDFSTKLTKQQQMVEKKKSVSSRRGKANKNNRNGGKNKKDKSENLELYIDRALKGITKGNSLEETGLILSPLVKGFREKDEESKIDSIQSRLWNALQALDRDDDTSTKRSGITERAKKNLLMIMVSDVLRWSEQGKIASNKKLDKKLSKLGTFLRKGDEDADAVEDMWEDFGKKVLHAWIGAMYKIKYASAASAGKGSDPEGNPHKNPHNPQLEEKLERRIVNRIAQSLTNAVNEL